MEEANETKNKQKGKEIGVEKEINQINPMSLVMNWMNLVSLVGQIVCLCQFYSEDE